MTKLNIYLNFAGKAEEAFGFYKGAFGGEFSSLVRFKDMPMPGATIPKDAQDKILHIALPVGSDILMASDALESMGQKLTAGNNSHISIQVDSKAEADRLYKVLSAGGKVHMPLGDQPWGDYYANFADKYGIGWMISYTYPKKG